LPNLSEVGFLSGRKDLSHVSGLELKLIYSKFNIGVNETKWVFNLQGGGYCINEADCADRANVRCSWEKLNMCFII
jgi:hypothetical protein